MALLKKYRWIGLLIGLAILLRVFLYLQIMNQTAFYDYFAYKEWIYKSYSQGFAKVYLPDPKSTILQADQPPGTIYILRGSYEAFLLTTRVITSVFDIQPNEATWINTNLLVFFFRLPSIVADIILGFCIYLFVKSKTNEKLAIVASAFYLFNPGVFYNSTIWGQLDSINNLFFYLSLVFLLQKRAFLSVLFYALSLYCKLSLLPLLPLYVLVALFGGFFKTKAFITAVIATCIIVVAISFPFSTNPLWIFNFILQGTGGMNHDITVNAFNVWWLLFNPAIRTSPPTASTVYFGLSLSTWGYLLFAGFYVPILWYCWKLIKTKKLTIELVFLLSALAAFAIFLFLPKMHERYLYPALPLLITWVALRNRYWVITGILSVIHFLNLYIIWNPNNFFFGPFENAITSQNTKWILSLATLSIFGFFYVNLFKTGALPLKSVKKKQ